jgi:glycerol-3-phosphate acyltransferase PlsY
MWLLLTAAGFLLGSLPFALWIGRLTTGQDIRHFGDGNPGATNVLRAGSRGGFLLALILDTSKSALPVGLAYQQLGIQDWRIIPIALAPVAGHAFSPFLRGRGGQALAAALGVWIGLTIWKLSLVALAALIVWRLLISPKGWSTLLALATQGVAIVVWYSNPVFLAILAGQALILLSKQAADLRLRPRLKFVARGQP